MIFRAAQNCFNIPCSTGCTAHPIPRRCGQFHSCSYRNVRRQLPILTRLYSVYTVTWVAILKIELPNKICSFMILSPRKQAFKAQLKCEGAVQPKYCLCIPSPSECTCVAESEFLSLTSRHPSVAHTLPTQQDLSSQAARFIGAVNIWNIKYKN